MAIIRTPATGACKGRLKNNLGENAPIALILLSIAALQGAPGAVLYRLGIGFLLAWLWPARALAATPQVPLARQIGITAACAIIILAAPAALGHALR